MVKLHVLEAKMSKLFTDKAPKLPAGGKKFFVDFAPWLAVLGGLFSLAAFNLWRWAHVAGDTVNYVNSLCNAYAIDAGACAGITASRFSYWLWLAILVLLVESALYLLAFPGLRERQKKGWNFLFYAALINVMYAVISLFTGYNSVGSFIFALLVSAVSFWILFQIRSAYESTTDIDASDIESKDVKTVKTKTASKKR